MSIEIPKQLQKKEFRFIKIKYKSKQPIENDWQNTANYEYNNPKLLSHIENQTNYGVLGGYGGLVIIDADTEKIAKTIENKLPKTFTVKTGKGKHYYFICKNLIKPFRITNKNTGDLGDVQGKGKQVIGAGSIHPTGTKYEILYNEEIKEIEIEKIKIALKEYMKEVEETKQNTTTQGQEISIEQVVNLSSLKKQGNEFFGEHPIHGSTNGMNFWVNTTKNLWHCFRHDSGGDALYLIAVQEGIIDCSDATRGGLRGDAFLKTIELAKSKYGLKLPEQKPKVIVADKINPNEVADLILNETKIKTIQDDDEMLSYNEDTGLYEPNQSHLEKIIQDYCGNKTTTHIVTEVLNSIKRQTRIPREMIGTERNLIPLENGIYNFMKEELIPYSSEYVFLKKHPIYYSKEKLLGENPIDKFLKEITESQEDTLQLKEIIGYCFYRGMPFQTAFLLIGAGANGKSVYLNLIRAMLGRENVSNESLQSLTENRFASANLYQKNANVFGDLPAKAFRDVGLLKLLTGGDVVTAEQKFKASFGFINYAKIIASCNEVPETPDTTEGFFRRWIIINFPRSFEKNANPNLLEELIQKQYLSDFFNSCIEAFRDALKDNSFIRKESTAKKKERYMNYSNSPMAFCELHLEYEPEGMITTDDIYKEYKKFCKEKKLIMKDERIFFQKMYKFFNHKVYKTRVKEVGVRYHVINGVEFKGLSEAEKI